VNVYLDGEYLEHRHIESKQPATVQDDLFDERATVAIHVEYGDDSGLITFETDGETVEYSRANNPECIPLRVSSTILIESSNDQYR